MIPRESSISRGDSSKIRSLSIDKCPVMVISRPYPECTVATLTGPTAVEELILIFLLLVSGKDMNQEFCQIVSNMTKTACSLV